MPPHLTLGAIWHKNPIKVETTEIASEVKIIPSKIESEKDSLSKISLRYDDVEEFFRHLGVCDLVCNLGAITFWLSLSLFFFYIPYFVA